MYVLDCTYSKKDFKPATMYYIILAKYFEAANTV